MTSPRIVRPIAHARAATARPGFSMVELMIAIMILGLGLVMAATIFPIGLDMTRETLQSNTALTLADNAVDTILLKVPGRNPNVYRPATPPTDVAVRLVPRTVVPRTDWRYVGTGQSTIHGWLGLEDDANITGPDVTAFNELGNPFHVLGSEDAGDWLKSLNGSPTANIVAARTLAFTGHSLFDADFDARFCYVISAQNLPGNYQNLFSGTQALFVVPRTPFIGPPNARRPARLHLTDVIDVRPDLTAEQMRALCKSYHDTSGLTRKSVEIEICRAAETARYSWTAFARRVPNSNRMKLTIAVTYRGELGSRYAPQRDQRSNPIDPLSMSANELEEVPGNDLEDTLMFPRPDPDQTKHTLFPQPWLVVVTRIIEAQGIVECTNDIARLLPVNSRLVIAREGSFPAGTALTVLSSTVNLGEVGNKPASDHQMTTLRIAANADESGTGRADDNVPVWIFPPAVVSTDGLGEFAARSPVVAVFEREVVLP